VKKMKKQLVIIGFLILFTSVAYAQETGYSDKIEKAIVNCTNCNVCPDGKVIDNGKVCVYFFWGQGCPHCAEEKPFLEELKKKYPNIQVYDFEVYYSQENMNFWKEVCQKYGVQPYGVPMTFIGNKVFAGFAKRELFSNSTKVPSSDFVLPFSTALGITLACVFGIVVTVFFITKKVKIKVKI